VAHLPDSTTRADRVVGSPAIIYWEARLRVPTKNRCGRQTQDRVLGAEPHSRRATRTRSWRAIRDLDETHPGSGPVERVRRSHTNLIRMWVETRKREERKRQRDSEVRAKK
jgi:hypothetical protein